MTVAETRIGPITITANEAVIDPDSSLYEPFAAAAKARFGLLDTRLGYWPLDSSYESETFGDDRGRFEWLARHVTQQFAGTPLQAKVMDVQAVTAPGEDKRGWLEVALEGPAGGRWTANVTARGPHSGDCDPDGVTYSGDEWHGEEWDIHDDPSFADGDPLLTRFIDSSEEPHPWLDFWLVILVHGARDPEGRYPLSSTFHQSARSAQLLAENRDVQHVADQLREMLLGKTCQFERVRFASGPRVLIGPGWGWPKMAATMLDEEGGIIVTHDSGALLECPTIAELADAGWEIDLRVRRGNTLAKLKHPDGGYVTDAEAPHPDLALHKAYKAMNGRMGPL